jgi:hypothetical protein
MKTTLLTIFMVLATAVSLFALNSKILAQDSGSTCVTQCTDRFTDCRDEAVTNLENCLTNATSPAEKARCKVAFRSERGACRVADETCLNTCDD